MMRFWIGITISFLMMNAEVHAQSNRDWKKAGFKKLVRSEYVFSNGNQFQIDPTVIILRNSTWNKELVLERLGRAHEIYQQCNVDLGRITLLEVTVPRRKVDLETLEEARKLSYQIPEPTRRPILFYYRHNPQGAIAYSYSVCHAYGRPFVNTVWISKNAEFYEKQSVQWSGDTGYNMEAHELGHILLDDGHQQPDHEKNLMTGDPRLWSDTLTSFQCEIIRKSTLLKTAR